MIDHVQINNKIQLDLARESCHATDQQGELTFGCETWGILCDGGQRGQMSRWDNGRGAVCFGGPSLWGEWDEELDCLVLDDGTSYDREGRQVLAAEE